MEIISHLPGWQWSVSPWVRQKKSEFEILPSHTTAAWLNCLMDQRTDCTLNKTGSSCREHEACKKTDEHSCFCHNLVNILKTASSSAPKYQPGNDYIKKKKIWSWILFCWCSARTGHGCPLTQVWDPCHVWSPCTVAASLRCQGQLGATVSSKQDDLLVYTSRQRIALTASLTLPTTGITSLSPIQASVP